MTGMDLRVGDCREILRTLDAESVDAVVTDPPYGTENGDGYGRRQNHGGQMGRTIAGDADLSLLAETVPLWGRVLKPDAWVALFCSPKRRHEVDALLLAAGFTLFGEVVWDKGPGLGRAIRYGHETIIIAAKGEPERAERALLSVLRHPAPARVRQTLHPHEKPVPVMLELVRWCCPVGGLVLDPFAGIGTTGIACVEEGRRFMGCELSEEYAAIARRRIANAQPVLFGT